MSILHRHVFIPALGSCCGCGYCNKTILVFDLEKENMNSKVYGKICSYAITPMTPDDRQSVFEFLKIFFFQQEPLIVCLKLFEDVESLGKLQDYGFRTLDNGLTLKAVSPNGELIGVISNEIVSRDSEEHYTNDQDEKNTVQFQKFMTLFQKVEQESDVFKKYPKLDRIMNIKIVAVNEAFRGQGLCKALFDKTKELALENECSIIRVECSSHFSACAAERLEFQCVYNLCYQDYKNEKGELIFDSYPPHENFKVYEYVFPVQKL